MRGSGSILEVVLRVMEFDEIVPLQGNSLYKVFIGGKNFYIYLKNVTPAYLPHNDDLTRIQIPHLKEFDEVLRSTTLFLPIGYDYENKVFVIWNPEKIKERLNKRKNVSLYSTLKGQKKVHDTSEPYHYVSKQLQDAYILPPDHLEKVIKDYLTETETVIMPDKTIIQPNTNSVDKDWETPYTNNGKLTKITNPKLLALLKPCFDVPYPTYVAAYHIISDFYGLERFPNMQLRDWDSLLKSIDWNENIHNDMIVSADDTMEAKPLEKEHKTRKRWASWEMILVLDFYFKYRKMEKNERKQAVQELSTFMGRKLDSVDMRLRNYEYCNSGTGLSGGGTDVKVYWDKYVNNRAQLERDAKDILKEHLGIVEDEPRHTKKNLWSDDEMILALDLYYKLSFGQFYKGNREVQKLAALTGRTPSSIAMRLCNYEYLRTGRGLSGGKIQCKPFLDKYENNRKQLESDAQAILANRQQTVDECIEDVPSTGKDSPAVREEFWREFILYSKAHNGIYASSKPSTHDWLGRRTLGIKGAGLSVILGKKVCRCEIYINTGDKAQNKQTFDYLYAHRSEINKRIPDIVWQRLDEKDACRIRVDRPLSYLKQEDREAMFEFFLTCTNQMLEVFTPYASLYGKDQQKEDSGWDKLKNIFRRNR